MLRDVAIGRSTSVFDPAETLVVVVEMSLSSWLVAGLLPGVERRPLKKLIPDELALFSLVERWRVAAASSGRTIKRVVLAYEAGRDGFWLARCARARGIEAHVMHASSIAVSRDRRRAKTDRLAALRSPEGSELPARSLAELRRDMARLGFIEEQIAQIEQERQARIDEAPADAAANMVRTLTRIVGVGVETADMLTHEILLRNLRDRRAVASYAGLTGSPDESGARRRERGLSRAGNARVRRGMVQLAWRFLVFQKESALVRWYRARTVDARGRTRMAMIVALARKLLIALWRMAKTGEVPEGVAVRPVAA
ncbi:MAG: family transposase [Rhodospirillales bacterium]|nr:family transposase [Rhodospirillales bacterium]